DRGVRRAARPRPSRRTPPVLSPHARRPGPPGARTAALRAGCAARAGAGDIMERLDRATRTYERLMRLYPPAYRERFGTEIQQTFRDLYREEARHEARFWARSISDLATGVLQQYGSLIRSQSEMKPTVRQQC